MQARAARFQHLLRAPRRPPRLFSSFSPRPRSVQLSQVARQMAAPTSQGGVAVGTYSYKLRKHRECFQGSDGASWLSGRFRITRATAVELGQRMVDGGLVEGLAPAGGSFSDSNALFRFTSAVFTDAGGPVRSFLSVAFADGAEKKFELDTKQSTRVCVDLVAEAAGVTHGVKEWSLLGKRGWLAPDLPVADQWNEIDGPLLFRKKVSCSR